MESHRVRSRDLDPAQSDPVRRPHRWGNERAYFIMGAGLVTPPFPPRPSCDVKCGQHQLDGEGMIDSNTQYDGPLPSKVCPFPLTAKSQVYCRSWDGSQVGELTSYGLPAVYRPQPQHVSKGLRTNLIWKSGPSQFLTSNFTSPSNVVWDSPESGSERTA